ncbi:hypothetical protein [Streptomyces sp. Inha503]
MRSHERVLDLVTLSEDAPQTRSLDPPTALPEPAQPPGRRPEPRH